MPCALCGEVYDENELDVSRLCPNCPERVVKLMAIQNEQIEHLKRRAATLETRLGNQLL